MRRILTIAAAVMLLATTEANAQAFLNKLKEKAEAAVGGALQEKLGEKLGIDLSATEEQAPQEVKPESKPEIITPEQQLQRRRTSTFGWDGKVSPSSTSQPMSLINELPKVPSAKELADPTEAGMISFYNALKRVTLRAEELNADTTCEDAFAEEWRKKQEDKLCNALGLTKAEWDLLNSENITDAQREALEAKMAKAILGDVDIEKAQADAQSQMARYESMSDEEREAMIQSKAQDDASLAIAAMMDVYKSDPAETKYVTGCTPDEIEKAMKSDDPENSPEAKKMKEYEKKMTVSDGKAYTKRKKALEDKIQAASMAAMRSQMSVFAKMAQNASNFEKKMDMRDIQAAERRYMDASMPMFSAFGGDTDIDAKFSAAERNKVLAWKKKIYSTDDPAVYNPLYAQALEAIKTYRLRAAALWSAAVQKRVDNIKAQMPGYIEAQRQAVADGILPECGMMRAPLNAVIQAGDILEEAYSEFPCDYPHMYKEEVADEITLALNEDWWWPEFYYPLGSIDDILMRKFLFKAVYEDGKYQIYQWDGAKWGAVPKDFDEKKLAGTKAPESAVWKSSDGIREVIYNADGHWIQLPEGDVVYPIAIGKTDHVITWLTTNEIVDEPHGKKKIQIIKCTYKL